MIDPARPDFANTPVSEQRPHFGYAHGPAAPPLVSIVTPFFNTGEVFSETAQSVLQQSLQQFEWIVVNDNSSDPAALAILDHYRRRDPRLRVIDLPANSGACAARNRGVEAAQTGFIVHLDSDDLLEPTTIEKWLWFLIAFPDYGAVTSYLVHFAASPGLRLSGFELGRTMLDHNVLSTFSMVRREVHDAAGGFNEANRAGLTDWEYWMRVANAGYWGGTVPELLTWYRRRLRHSVQWPNWHPERRQVFLDNMRQTYARLWRKDGFPAIHVQPDATYSIPDSLPCPNLLSKSKPRLLFIAGGGLDPDLLRQTAVQGWEATLAITDPVDNTALARFACHTPDVFVLPNFVRLPDYACFLHYLIASRQADAVLLCGSEAGYLLLPYLRARCPGLWFGDYRAAKDGDATIRLSLAYRGLLDLTMVAAPQIKQSMIDQGSDANRIVVQCNEMNLPFVMEVQRHEASAITVSAGLGQACAIQAVEYLRLADQAHLRSAQPSVLPPAVRPPRLTVFGAAKRLVPVPIKRMIKKALRRT